MWIYDDYSVQGEPMPGSYAIGFIGDSITEGNAYPAVTPAPEQCGALVAAATGLTVTVVNEGIAGTKSANWVPGGTLTSAKNAFAAAGVLDVCIMLGANDCKTGENVAPATYGSNLASTASNLVSAGYRVWLNYPSFCTWDAGSPSLNLPGYCDEIDAIVNGTTIRQGDTSAYAEFEANRVAYIPDGVHPDADGTIALATLWAAPLIAAYLPLRRVPRVSVRGGRVRVH